MVKRSNLEEYCPKCGVGIIGKNMKRHIDSKVCRNRAAVMKPVLEKQKMFKQTNEVQIRCRDCEMKAGAEDWAAAEDVMNDHALEQVGHRVFAFNVVVVEWEL